MAGPQAPDVRGREAVPVAVPVLDGLDERGLLVGRELGEPAPEPAVRVLVQAVQDGDGDWHGLAPPHVWSLWTRHACTAFYSHPWAWNEIGFPGPAYPRGYLNLGVDAREKHEERDAEPADPVTAGRRVEQARREHAELLDRGTR